ncbi:Hypothetical predicted protein [Cloeon dipterum]|uniref:Uncharacterized protein n=1 Tax=Cloeon dipterum TaxID=197152 RepID=A0A8S1CZI9_9INSE|nr:Hypothetical predicted protein [Cloeon dipterum]
MVVPRYRLTDWSELVLLVAYRRAASAAGRARIYCGAQVESSQRSNPAAPLTHTYDDTRAEFRFAARYVLLPAAPTPVGTRRGGAPAAAAAAANATTSPCKSGQVSGFL